MRRFLLFAALLWMVSCFVPTIQGQTLGEVLRATQERWNLLEQANASSYGPGGTPPNLQPIQWAGGVSASPTDAEVNALPVETQIALLRQAGYQVRGMYSGYADSRLVSNGVGLLGTVYIEWPEEITTNNFAWQLQRLAHLLTHMKTVVWGASWTLDGYTTPPPVTPPVTNPPTPPPPPPPPPTPPLTFLDGQLDDEGSNAFPFPSISTGVSTVLAASYSGHWSALWTSITGLQATAPTGVGGTFDFYSGAHYTHQAVGGMAWPSPATGGPEAVRLSSTPATSGGTADVDLGSFDSVGGDPSSLSLPGSWLNTPYTHTSSDGTSWTQTITQFVPAFTSADLASAAIWANPADASRPYYNGSNPYWGPDNNAVDDLHYFYNLYNGPGVAIGFGYGEWYTQTFHFSSYFTADFSKDFSFPASAVPEQLPPLQIVPDLAHGMLKVALDNAPASECGLMWGVSAATTPCAARCNLSVAGCGDWDAVYSGAATDREPEYQWQGIFSDQNKRWAGFGSYLNEWWRPVLTQLKTATWTVNITQQGRYKYLIDFYYSSQVGTRSVTNGRYTFTGSPAESWTVENASADDTTTGQIRITTPTAVYDLAVAAPSTGTKQWSLTAHDRQGTPAAFLSKNVTLTTNFTPSQTPGTTVVDTTSVDGAALPVVTTTYWYLGTPDKIDQIAENGGTEGTRTTQYTYAPSTELPSNITQTGGTNPYSADYDLKTLPTNYVSGSSQVQTSYNGAVATRTESFGGANMRTAQTTYSGDMTNATTSVSGSGDAPAATVQFFSGDDPIYPWGLQLVRGYDGTLTTYSYAWSGTPGSSDLVTTITRGPESSSNPGTVAAGTQTVTKTNGAGMVWSTVTTDLESNLTVDFATATAFQNGNTPFPSTFSRPLGTTDQYAYDAEGRVTSHTDQLGIAQSFTLDAIGRVTQSTRNGLTWTIAYNQNALGRSVSLTDGNTTRTRTETTSPFGSNQSVSITGPENITTTRTETLDSTGTITMQTTDSTTGQTRSEVVTKGSLATAVTGNASEPWNVTYSFPSTGGYAVTTTHGDDSSLTSTTTYDALGRMTRLEAPSPSGSGTATTTYGYTGGRLTTSTDSALAGTAGTTIYAYAPDGSLQSASRGDRLFSCTRTNQSSGQITWTLSDAAGTLGTTTYHPTTGITTDLPWGLSSRQVTSTPSYTTGALQRLDVVGQNWGSSQSWHDGTPVAGGSFAGSESGSWSAVPNAFGDLTSLTTTPGGATANNQTTTFSSLGLPTDTSGLVSSHTDYQFDQTSGVTATTTRNGKPGAQQYSPKGYLLADTGYGKADAHWSPPAYGPSTITRTLTTTAGPANFTWNLAGLLTERRFPDGTAESLGYNSAGFLTSWTTPRTSFAFTPNAFGEPTFITSGGATVANLGYDNRGQCNAISDAAGSRTLFYDKGQFTGESTTSGVLANQAVGRVYDGLGRLQTVSLPGGKTVGYSYSTTGDLNAVTTAGGTGGTWSNFDGVTGRAKQLTLGALSVASGYDGQGRVQSQASTAGGGTWSYGYGYDGDGHCNTRSSPEGAWTYGYDANGYLNSATVAGQSFAYGFDESGRSAANHDEYRTTVRLNSSTVQIFGSVAPGASVKINNVSVPVNATTGVFSLTDTPTATGWLTYQVRGTLPGVGYGGTDAVADTTRQVFLPPASEALGYTAGSRTSDARWSYGWNALEQMTSMVELTPQPGSSGARTIYCTYDLEGRRVEKKVLQGGQLVNRTTTLWDGWQPVMDIDYQAATEVARRYYTWGPDVSGDVGGAAGIGGLLEVLEIKPGAPPVRSLVVQDGQGNVVGLVDAATGARVATYQYGPFGEVVSVTGERADSCPLRFQTKRYDDETGLCYFGKRYYDPKAQAWLSRDPLREGGGVNLYAYCKNDPVTGHDPIGLDDEFLPGELAAGGRLSLSSIGNISLLPPPSSTTPFLPPPFPIEQWAKENYITAGDRWVMGHPRWVGAGKAFGSLVETGTGLFGAAAPTGVTQVFGTAAVFHGLDGFHAGMEQLISGTPSETYTQKGMTSLFGAAGYDPNTAAKFGAFGDAGLSFVFTLGASASVVIESETAILTNLKDQAIARFDQEGFTPTQQRALIRNPGLLPRFRGERIDTFFKELVEGDSRLQHFIVTPRRLPKDWIGPDVFDPETQRWWDVTTRKQWENHVRKYWIFGKGTPLFTE